MLSRSQLLKAAQLAVRTSTASRCFSISASRNGGGLTAYDTGTTRDYIHTRIGKCAVVYYVFVYMYSALVIWRLYPLRLRKKKRIHGYPSRVRLGRSSAGESH